MRIVSNGLSLSVPSTWDIETTQRFVDGLREATIDYGEAGITKGVMESLINQGWGNAQMADHFDVSITWISRKRGEFGLQGKKGRKKRKA